MSDSVNMVAQGWCRCAVCGGSSSVSKCLCFAGGEEGWFMFGCGEVQSKLEATGGCHSVLCAQAREGSSSGGQKATAELSEL